MNKDSNDDGMLLLASIVKKFSVVELVLGIIGSFFVGKLFFAFLIASIISSIGIYILGEILERVVLCDANIRVTYEEVAKLQKEKESINE